MEAINIARKAQRLGDVELAMLLSLMAQRHCMLETKMDYLDDLADEGESL